MSLLRLLFALPVFILASGIPPVQAAEASAPVASTVVAADGSGEFKTIQEAINAAPQLTDTAHTWTIRIKPGTYHELIYVMREKRFIRLVGDDPAKTIVTEALYAGMLGHDGKQIGTFRTPTLWIDADDFQVEGLTIENTAGAVGQAVALRVDGDRVSFRHCRLHGWQDTILVNRGRQYFVDCEITGAIDFIFGGATSYFERCAIKCLGDGYITAASTLPYDAHGMVFSHCAITGANPKVQTYLGRPWRAYASVAFLNSSMEAVVKPAGWDNWDRPDREKSSRYAEFGSTGAGAPDSGRVSWVSHLTVAQAAALTVAAVLGGPDHWIP